MSLSEQFQLLKATIVNAENELNSLETLNRKSAAPRFRKSLQNIKLQSQLLRKNTTEHTKALPVKPRVKKPVTILELLAEPTPTPTPAPTPEPVEHVEPTKKKTKTNKSKKV
jgi:hypothetical protein